MYLLSYMVGIVSPDCFSTCMCFAFVSVAHDIALTASTTTVCFPYPNHFPSILNVVPSKKERKQFKYKEWIIFMNNCCCISLHEGTCLQRRY